MREITFKVFNKTQGRMSDPFTLIDLLRVEVPLLSDSIITDELVWLEYIGIKDKKGVGIFEGDEVEWTWQQDILAPKYTHKETVTYDETRGIWIPMGVYHHDMNDPQHGYYNCQMSEYEIIGSCHENPELIE